MNAKEFLRRLEEVRKEFPEKSKKFPSLPTPKEIVLPTKSLLGGDPCEHLIDSYKFMLERGRYVGTGKYLFPYVFSYGLPGAFVWVFFVNIEKGALPDKRYAHCGITRERIPGEQPKLVYFEYDDPEFVIPDVVGDESYCSDDDV